MIQAAPIPCSGLDCEAVRFHLETVYGTLEPRSWIVVTAIRPTAVVRAGGPRVVSAAFRPDDLTGALRWVLQRGGWNLYVTITAQDEPPPPGSRATEARAAALVGLCLDVDLREGKPYAERKYPTGPQAVAALEQMPVPPSFVVATGGGYHPWWLLNEPLAIESEADRQRARRLTTAWQRACLDRLREASGTADPALDSTGDLARLFRLAGTVNHNHRHRPWVRLLDAEHRPLDRNRPVVRYWLDDLEIEPARAEGPSVPFRLDGSLALEERRQILAGVPQGHRHEAAKRYIGSRFADLRDPRSEPMVQRLWVDVEAWNDRNRPALERDELLNLFLWTLRQERAKRAAEYDGHAA